MRNRYIRNIFFISLGIILAYCTFALVTGYNLVIPVSTYRKQFTIKVKTGRTVKIFSHFDFSKDNWKAYLVIGSDDFTDLHPSINKCSCLKTTNRHLLEQMKRTWKFKITEGDIATVSSQFFLIKNGKLVFKTGIVLDKNVQRLQNEEYGEMEPVNNLALINSCKEFKKVYWPVVFL